MKVSKPNIVMHKQIWSGGKAMFPGHPGLDLIGGEDNELMLEWAGVSFIHGSIPLHAKGDLFTGHYLSFSDLNSSTKFYWGWEEIPGHVGTKQNNTDIVD